MDVFTIKVHIDSMMKMIPTTIISSSSEKPWNLQCDFTRTTSDYLNFQQAPRNNVTEGVHPARRDARDRSLSFYVVCATTNMQLTFVTAGRVTGVTNATLGHISLNWRYILI